MLGTYGWANAMFSDDIVYGYDFFMWHLTAFALPLPLKSIKGRPSYPDYITSLVKSLLSK